MYNPEARPARVWQTVVDPMATLGSCEFVGSSTVLSVLTGSTQGVKEVGVLVTNDGWQGIVPESLQLEVLSWQIVYIRAVSILNSFGVSHFTQLPVPFKTDVRKTYQFSITIDVDVFEHPRDQFSYFICLIFIWEGKGLQGHTKWEARIMGSGVRSGYVPVESWLVQARLLLGSHHDPYHII